MDCFSVADVKNMGKDGNLLFTMSTECFLVSVMVIEQSVLCIYLILKDNEGISVMLFCILFHCLKLEL